MKVKFTKLAALLLAGAALFATGCTDYEVDIQKVEKEVTEANAKIASLEDQLKALESLLTTSYETIADHQKDIKAINDEIKKLKEADEANAGEIAKLQGRMEKAEAAIKKMEDETIPAIKKQIEDLQNLKLDKADFETYKAETAQTIKLMQDAIDELAATKLDKTEFETKIAEIIAKFDDYVLTTTFEEFKKIAATKEELNNVKNELTGRIEAAEGDIDKLKKKLAEITNEEGTGRLDVLENTAAKLRTDVDDLLKLVKFAEGDLQGYIDNAAKKAFDDACAYADDLVEELKDALMYYIVDLYNSVFTALQRIQSVVFVPTHDDLKVNMNIAGITVGEDESYYPMRAEEEKPDLTGMTTYVGQPTEVTYKVTPTEYAPWLGSYVKALLGYEYFDGIPDDKPLAQLYKEYFDYSFPAVYFDTKPVETRADGEEEEETPLIQILDVVKYDAESGEVTFLVMPYGIASPQFVATQNKPSFEMDLMDYYYGGYIYAGSYASYYEDLAPIWGIEDGAYTVGVWDAEDLQDFLLRKAFATSLTVYVPDYDNWNLYMDIGGDLEMDDYFLFHNEVSSTYNVLYPVVSDIKILPDPGKPELDENGDVVTDEDGYTKVVIAVPEHQELPYNALRKNATEEEPGFRTILKDAAPIVSVNGDDPMFLDEAEDKYGIVLPVFTAAFDEFDVEQNTATSEVNMDNFILTEKVYAEVEMNPESPASDRKLAIGNLITGYYTWTSDFGKVYGEGDVLITKELGSIDVTAEAVWTWNWNKGEENAENLGDAIVDHNLFYETGEEPQLYSRVAWPVAIDEEGAAKLEADLGLTLADFDHQEPVEFTITVADVPEDEAEPEFEALAEDADFEIKNVAIVDGELVADFVGFEWDKIYKVVAVYDLPYAKITVNGTFTTKDRNREMVTLDKYEYTFEINKLDEETGFGWLAEDKVYYWKSEPMHKAIFKVFDAEGVINVEGNVDGDFEFDADQEDFNEGELNGKIRAYNEEPGPGTAFKYVDINREGIYGVTKTANSQISAQDLKDMNSGVQDPNDPYTFLGNVIYRYITTYIGEVVEIPFQFNYKVPAYDFLHQENYTFDDGKWYTMASPKYDPNKQTLQKYDVNYMNVPALAYNIIDENKRFFNYLDELEENDPTYFYDENLYINFYYTGPDPVDETELEDQSTTDEIKTYGDLWFNATDKGEEYSVEEADNFEHTVFYYRSIRDAIPMYGTLEIESDGVRFEIPTSFEKDNGGKYLAKQDYSNYELRAWKPFYVPTYNQTVYIDLDEHVDYTANILEGLQFFDARQVAASTAVDTVKDPFVEGTYSIEGFNYGVKAYFRPMLGFNDDAQTGEKVWGWVMGNDKNGYVSGTTSWEAYDLQMKNFVFDDHTGVPQDLRRLISVDEENYVMTFDYNSQIEFMGTAEVDFSFDFQTPWQKFEKPFSVKVVIRGLDQQ